MSMRAFLLIFFLYVAVSGQQPATLAQFSLPKLDGQTLRSQDLKDNIVILDFWATWCENCVNEIPTFIEDK
jgi:thiol-disulfide isomerase/thioredoxin